MTNIIRTKKGGAPGKIIGSIVILVWVFFLLKFGIGYLSFRAQLKSYIPVTAEVVNTIEHKDTVTNEEGRRTTERTYTVDIKYMYNTVVLLVKTLYYHLILHTLRRYIKTLLLIKQK